MKIKLSILVIIFDLFLFNYELLGKNKELVDYVNPLLGTLSSRWMLLR